MKLIKLNNFLATSTALAMLMGLAGRPGKRVVGQT
jgi:NaMN:DMB phosphoribosyltransferase